MFLLHPHHRQRSYSDERSEEVMRKTIEFFETMFAEATPTQDQERDTDWLLAVGEIFTQIVYAQLVLKNTEIYAIDQDVVDETFDVAVRDMARFVVVLHGKAATTPEQGEYCQAMIRKPAGDDVRYERVWQDHVYALRDAYQMAE